MSSSERATSLPPVSPAPIFVLHCRLLVHSLCPSIYGHELVKAALLMALFGGRVRGEETAVSEPISKWSSMLPPSVTHSRPLGSTYTDCR